VEETERTNRAQRRAAQTRASLLVASRQLLSERGFTNVTISDITDRADVALGSFYNHFEHRDNMITTVMDQARKSQRDLVLKVLDQLGTEGYGPMCSIVVASVHRATLDPEFAGLIYNAALHRLWPDQDQLRAVRGAATIALAESDVAVSVNFITALIGWSSGMMMSPGFGANFENPQHMLSETVSGMLRIVSASSNDTELWVKRSLDVPLDLSISENGNHPSDS